MNYKFDIKKPVSLKFIIADLESGTEEYFEEEDENVLRRMAESNNLSQGYAYLNEKNDDMYVLDHVCIINEGDQVVVNYFFVM